MSVKPDAETLEAMKKEGYIGKQGRSVLNKYFQRYWKIIDHGLTLGYALDKQEFEQGKLKGKVALKDILTIIDEQKPKKFHLVCEGRVYKLEASSSDDKKSWIEALNKCIKYATKHAEEEKKDLMNIDDDIVFEEENDDLDEKSTEKFNLLQPIGIIANTAKAVAVDTALNTAVKIVKTGVNAVGDALLGGKLSTNEDFLAAKNLKQTLELIDPKILQCRIMMGYLYKETKEATGFDLVDDLVNDVGIRDTLTRQWFLLVSSKPIVFDKVDREDEQILDAGKLPFEIEPEVLFAYEETCDNSPPVESIPLADVTDVIIKKKANREQFYRFVLNLGQKKVHLITHNILEMTTWVKAIQASRATIKENVKSKLPTVKNIYWHIKILDEQGEEDLSDKIELEYESLVSKVELEKLDGVTGMIAVQKTVANQLISVVNACLAHKNRRLDIIKLYVNCFHENIILSLRNFFKKKEKTIENRDCFEIINFLVWYRDMVLVFGDAFSDKRIIEGIKILCEIVSRRILKANLESVQNIIKQEGKSDPRVDGKNRLATNGPQDIFRIVNESFSVYSYCKCNEFATGLLWTAKNTLLSYQEGLANMIKTYKLSVNQLAAFCNNTMTYISLVKQFIEQAENMTSLDSEKINEHFNEGLINKGFANVSKKAYESIAQDQFSKSLENWNNMFFLDINLKSSLVSSLQSVQAIMDKIHSNYTSKVDLACLEKVVTYYIQNFMKNVENLRFKKGDDKKISEKLDEDISFLKELFSKNLKPNVINDVLATMNHFYDFINTNYAFLSLSVKTIKEAYGDSIKWNVCESLIRIRNDELEQHEVEDILKSCREIYNNTQKSTDVSTEFNVFRHMEANIDESEDEDSSTDQNLDESTDSQDLSISITKLKKEKSSRNNSVVLSNYEGYLEAEKDEFLSDVGGILLAHLKFERRYFAIRRDVLYFYKNKSAESAMGSYKLSEATECGPVENDTLAFFINFESKLENKKRLFKADSTEKRDHWIKIIQKILSLEDRNTIIEVDMTEISFFKDTKPLFYEIEKNPIAKNEEPKRKTTTNPSTVTLPASNKPSFAPERVEKKSEGCCASFCRLFGFGSKKPANHNDYIQIKDEQL